MRPQADIKSALPNNKPNILDTSRLGDDELNVNEQTRPNLNKYPLLKHCYVFQ